MTRRLGSRALALALLGASAWAAAGCEADDADLHLFAPNAGAAASGIACLSDDDCADGDRRHCDLDTRSCVACHDDADCESGDEVCRFGLCFDPCLTDEDCTSGDALRCQPFEGICVECTSHSDCLEVESPVCVDFACVECAGDADCS